MPIESISFDNAKLIQASFSVKTLPSGFLPYPKDVKVTYRRYGWGELKKFSQSNLSYQDQLRFVLDGVTVTGMDKMLFTVPDVIYLGLIRKISDLNPTHFIITYVCPKCKKKTTFTILPSLLKFDELGAKKLPIKVELSCGEMKFKPLTVGDHIDLLDSVDTEKDNLEVCMLAKECCSHKYEEALEILNFSVDEYDAKILERVDELLYHGLTKVTNTCSNLINDTKCDHEISLALDGGEGFIQPFCRDRKSVEDSISFGN